MERNSQRGGGRGHIRGEMTQRTIVSDEIQATVIDHALDHGLAIRKVGL